MYTYGLDGTVETWDKPAMEPSKNTARSAHLSDAAQNRSSGAGTKGSKYTVLSFSLAGYEVTWCFGPEISTIFATNSKFPHNLYILSRRLSG